MMDYFYYTLFFKVYALVPRTNTIMKIAVNYLIIDFFDFF